MNKQQINTKNNFLLNLTSMYTHIQLFTSYIHHTGIKICSQYLHEIVQSLQPKLKRTNHSIEINCADTIEIYCHAGAISQIFTNLIINSIIHGFEGIEHGLITIDVELKGDRLNLHYQDNGLGVPQNKLPQLFDPFYTTKSNVGGTGLGTHIVYELVTDTLNGAIEAHCDNGKGLGFNIAFDNMR